MRKQDLEPRKAFHFAGKDYKAFPGFKVKQKVKWIPSSGRATLEATIKEIITDKDGDAYSLILETKWTRKIVTSDAPQQKYTQEHIISDATCFAEWVPYESDLIEANRKATEPDKFTADEFAKKLAKYLVAMK